MFAWLTIAILGALVLGALIAFNWRKSNGESAEERVWASYDEPIFFIQPMYGVEFARETTAQYERALELLEKHGNKFLKPEKHVFCWIHRATPHNAKLDFKEWREQCRVDERKYKEEFDLEKAKRALAKGKMLELFKAQNTEKVPLEKRDFERSENGNYE